MPDVEDEIRRSLRRLTDPASSGGDGQVLWDDLVDRRRRRRRRGQVLVGVPVAIVLALVAGFLLTRASDDPRSDVAAGDGGDAGGSTPPADPGGTLRVEHIEVVGNGPLDGGTQRVHIDFDQSLPMAEATYVPDITTLDRSPRLVYTTQGPDVIHVCESWHGVPAGAIGSVDLLIPASWFADDRAAHEGPGLETVDSPAKFVICGPHDGFIQYSIWAPLSADPDDVTVTVAPDRRSVTVEITPASPPGLDPVAGQSVVASFLDHLRAGELDEAAQLWTGYPEVGPTDDRVPFIQALVADPTFARLLVSETTTTFVMPTTGGTTGAQAVTILDAGSAGTPPAAIAFLTGFTEEQGGPGQMWIHRLPALDGQSTPTPPAGSVVAPGDPIVFPFVPVEGGAQAFVNGAEIPAVVDHEALTTTVTVPADAEGDVAITLVTATPELPGVQAVAVTVRDRTGVGGGT